VRHPERPTVIGDARFSMLPTTLTPLWGLAIDPDADRPVRHVTDRSLSAEERERFLAMLLGRPLPSSEDAP
jgi:inner membrane protein